MKYPNASDGVNKIYISEILALTASVIVVICSVIAMLCFDDPDLENLVIIMGVIIISAVGLYVAGYILQIVGIVRASKDEPAFKVSVIAIVAALITTILEAVFCGNHVGSFIVEIAGDVAKFFLVHYIIHGIMHISEHLERPDMIKKGKFIFRIIYTAIGFEVIVRIFELIFGKEVGEQLSMPFGVVANILQAAEYFMFLIYVGRAKKIMKCDDQKL